MKKRELRVVDLETREVVHRSDVTGKSDRHVERAMNGLLMKIDTDRYYVADSADDADEE